MSSEIKPTRTIVLCRISDDPEDERLGTARQRDDCLGLLGRLGWQAGPAETHLKVEDDTSAFKRAKVPLPDGRVELRTVRPKFRDALDMLASGRADGLVAYDLDRAVRDPRDLEDLIDVIEQSKPRIPVESVTGSLRLSNDGEVTMARVLVAVANKSSRDTSRRVARKMRENAELGLPHGSRAYGWDRAEGEDRRKRDVINEGEAAVIREAAEQVLAGVTPTAIARRLNAAGVAPPYADRGRSRRNTRGWTLATVKDVLLRPRNAGHVVYQGKDLGVMGGGAGIPAILEEGDWLRVKAFLTDPARCTLPASTGRKHLLSGIARCGTCGGPMRMRLRKDHAKATGTLVYICQEAYHVTRTAVLVDAQAEKAAVAWLASGEAAELLAASRDRHARDALALAEELRAQLDAAADMYARGAIDDRQLARITAGLRPRFEQAERDAAHTSLDPLVADAIGADAAARWAGFPLEQKRAVAALFDITAQPVRSSWAGRHGRDLGVTIARKPGADGQPG
jgi:site-specific DNA recombinase